MIFVEFSFIWGANLGNLYDDQIKKKCKKSWWWENMTDESAAVGGDKTKIYCNDITKIILLLIQLRILLCSFAYVLSYCACMLMNIGYAHCLYWNCRVLWCSSFYMFVNYCFYQPLASWAQLLNPRTSPFSKFAFSSRNFGGLMHLMR